MSNVTKEAEAMFDGVMMTMLIVSTIFLSYMALISPDVAVPVYILALIFFSGLSGAKLVENYHIYIKNDFGVNHV